MYLIRLYHYSKFLFFVFIFFICSQLYINSKIGVTATPFLHYGMYSAKSGLPSSVEVWEIEVNNKKVALQKLHPKIVDNILEPLNIFYNLAFDSGIVYQSKRLLTAISLPFNEANFHSSITKEQFQSSYLTHLRQILNISIDEVKVYRNTYNVRGSNFIQTRKLLFMLCR